MARTLPRRPRLNSVLELRALIESAQGDLVLARRELGDVERRLRLVRLYVGTAESYFETIVELYNRVAVEQNGHESRARRALEEG